jgi:hypothetical protein
MTDVEAGAHTWDIAKAEGGGWRTYNTDDARADLLAWQTHGLVFRNLAKSIVTDMLAGFDTSGMRIPGGLDAVVDAIAMEHAEFMDALAREAKSGLSAAETVTPDLPTTERQS